jgi:pimeloyl-ACP methyl ester carboxylesterase
MDIQAGYAEVEGTRLYYEVAGEGFPLILIHGFSADRRVWDYLFEPFANHYKAIRYDSRGFGNSALPDGKPYSHQQDLKALLDHLSISQAHIVGQSMGGEIGIEFALAYPQMVRSLVVVDAMLGGYAMSDAHNNSFQEVGAKTAEGGFKNAIDALMRHPMHAPLSEQPEAADKLRLMLAEYSAWHLSNADTWQRIAPPAIEQLASIQVPTLVVIGERDVPDFHAIADIVARDVPNARKETIYGVGHVVPLEAPQQLGALTLKFLASLG